MIFSMVAWEEGMWRFGVHNAFDYDKGVRGLTARRILFPSLLKHLEHVGVVQD